MFAGVFGEMILQVFILPVENEIGLVGENAQLQFFVLAVPR